MRTLAFLIIVYAFAISFGLIILSGPYRKWYIFLITVVALLGLLTVNDSLYSQLKGMWVKKQERYTAGQDQPASAFKPVYVYKDKNAVNRYVPSGLMPNGQCLNVDDAWLYAMKEGSSSIYVVYNAACSRERAKWAGVYWQNPPNNWGNQPGGHDLTGATKLKFWAKGETGSEIIKEFKVGGLGQGQAYPDTAVAGIADVKLTADWQEYEIDLKGKDLTRIAGGFAFSVTAQGNPDVCAFYLDEIRFE